MSSDLQRVPIGMGESPAGLMVPTESLALVREREVWTTEERDLLRRTIQLCEAHHLGLSLFCRDPRCQRKPTVEPAPSASGRMELVCPHKRRVLGQAGV